MRFKLRVPITRTLVLEYSFFTKYSVRTHFIIRYSLLVLVARYFIEYLRVLCEVRTFVIYKFSSIVLILRL